MGRRIGDKLGRQPGGRTGSTVGCLFIPGFPLACEIAARPDLLTRNTLVARTDQPVVWAASSSAERQGVFPGQSLREAIALCPDVEVIEGRPALYQSQAEAILIALERLVPGVEVGPEGVTYLDLEGLEARHPSIEALSVGLLGCVPPGLRPRVGIAGGKFTALAAAHAAAPGTAHLVPPARAVTFLKAQSVEVLPVSAEMLRRLRILGIGTLGELAKLGRGPLTAQFGPEGELAWKIALGRDRESVHPRPLRQRITATLSLATPLASVEPLLAAVDQVLSQACLKPEFRGRAARQLVVRMETERDDAWQRTINFKAALSRRDHMWPVVRPIVAQARPPGPVSDLALELAGIVVAQGWQTILPVDHGGRWDRLEEGLRKLRVQYGHCQVSRVVDVEPWSRIPERRVALIDYNP